MNSFRSIHAWPFFHSLQLSVHLFLCISFGLAVTMKLKRFLFNYRKSSETNYNYKLPPGPKPWPVVGNLPEMLLNTVVRKKPKSRWIHDIMNHFQTDIASIRLGNIHVIPVRSPEIVREFFRKKDAAFTSRPLSTTAECTSSGFLTVIAAPEGEQWKKMRTVASAHVINPSMKLQCMRQHRDEEADDLVRFIYKRCTAADEGSGAVVDVREAACHFSGNVIRRMLFGRRCFGPGREDGGPGFEEEEHVEAAFKVVGHLYALSPSDYNVIFRMLDLDGHGKIMEESMRNITKYQDPIIDERVKQWKDGNKTEPRDMLDLFILAKDSTGQHLSIKEIKAQCAEIFFATVLDPACIVEWTIAEMMNQPDILRKAVEEIDSIVGKERLVQESDLPSLRYVKACVRESFRLHPVSAFVPPHVSTADVVLAGYLIPKGSHVVLSRTGLGRNPATWDDPLKFNPEHHLKEDNSEVSFVDLDFKFISFGGGRRRCIGFSLASVMVMMLLTRLLQGFSWEISAEKDKIDLTESDDLLFLDQPLHVVANPRLHASAYPI